MGDAHLTVLDLGAGVHVGEPQDERIRLARPDGHAEGCLSQVDHIEEVLPAQKRPEIDRKGDAIHRRDRGAVPGVPVDAHIARDEPLERIERQLPERKVDPPAREFRRHQRAPLPRQAAVVCVPTARDQRRRGQDQPRARRRDRHPCERTAPARRPALWRLRHDRIIPRCPDPAKSDGGA